MIAIDHRVIVNICIALSWFDVILGEGNRVMVSTAAFHARVLGSFPGFGDL